MIVMLTPCGSAHHSCRQFGTRSARGRKGLVQVFEKRTPMSSVIDRIMITLLCHVLFLLTCVMSKMMVILWLKLYLFFVLWNDWP